MEFEHIEVPPDGEQVTVADEASGDLVVPDEPIIPVIHGDGTGKDVTPAALEVLSAAAEATGRRPHWMRLYAGESARERYDENLPDETIEALREFRVGMKGPLTTPVGAGYRSLNVALRKSLDLYANVRPTYHLEGVPSPIHEPEKMDLVCFREATEDVYAGIEWEANTEAAERVRAFVEDEMGFDASIHQGPAGIGLKPITEFGTKRLVRRAIDYALEHDRTFVTLVHKGNIMKYTEGAFRDWGYEVAEEEYGDEVITEDTLWEERDGEPPADTVVVNDRIADAMLQWLILRPDAYDILALPNLNGDYLSDAAGAQIGGLGIAPGCNVGDGRILAEPVHGSSPKYAGQDKVNPTAMILSGRILFDYLGWGDAGDLIVDALEATVADGLVTYDLARYLDDVTTVGTSEFAAEVAARIESVA
ncbi:MAG: NADP-dependent isocitrate dehydrogenase [Halobacteriota archaeon]